MTQESEEEKNREFQFRRTFEDTLQNQKKLKKYIKNKMYDNGFVPDNEESMFECLVARSFLSQGNWRKVYYENPDGVDKVLLGPVHTFAIELCELDSNTIEISRYSFVKIVPIKELWKILYDELPFIFPGALEEAFKTSGESRKEESLTPYSFKGEKV